MLLEPYLEESFQAVKDNMTHFGKTTGWKPRPSIKYRWVCQTGHIKAWWPTRPLFFLGLSYLNPLLWSEVWWCQSQEALMLFCELLWEECRRLDRLIEIGSRRLYQRDSYSRCLREVVANRLFLATKWLLKYNMELFTSDTDLEWLVHQSNQKLMSILWSLRRPINVRIC